MNGNFLQVAAPLSRIAELQLQLSKHEEDTKFHRSNIETVLDNFPSQLQKRILPRLRSVYNVEFVEKCIQ